MPPAPQALPTGVLVPLLTFSVGLPKYPGLLTFMPGLDTVGKDGKAALLGFTPGAVDVGRDGAGVGRALLAAEEVGADVVPQGIVVTLPLPVLLAGGSDGKLFGFDRVGPEGVEILLAKEPHPACWFTADRDDCAVDVFSRRMRFPAEEVLLDDAPGGRPCGPGSDG